MPRRKDRKLSVISEFQGKRLFDIKFVTPVAHEIPRVSHWLTFQHLTEKAKETQLPLFLFCEDDHVFTPDFDEHRLEKLVEESDQMEADMLLGGISWMQSPLQINERLFWVEKFNGIQFAIVYQRFYDRILSFHSGEDVITEIALSGLSDRIFVSYPFISIQKEFGYSDVTASNNQQGYVDELFEKARKKFDIQNKVRNYYLNLCK